MHFSTGMTAFLLACSAIAALEFPDETGLMQVQVKTLQWHSHSTTEIEAGFSYKTVSLNHSNASGQGCNVGIKKLPSDVGTKSAALLYEEAINATNGLVGVPKGIMRGGDVTMVTIEGSSCNCSQSLQDDPKVDYCEVDANYGAEAAEPSPVKMPIDFVPWNLDRIDSRRGFDNSYNVNEGMMGSIYDIDSGVLYTHVDSSGRAIPGIETEAGNLILCKPTNTTCSKDTWGHGSHIAGSCGGNSAGIAKLARVIGVRISGADKVNSMSGWMRAFSWVAKYASKPASIASVWGMNTRSRAVLRVCNTIINSGLSLGVSAGDKQSSACSAEPQNQGASINSGSFDRWDRRSWWSAFGMCISMFCPGESISAWGYKADADFVEMSGTSMSGPHGATAEMIILSRAPTLTPADVLMILVGDATKGILTNIGAGSPNMMLYIATDTGKCFPGEATVDKQEFGRISMMNVNVGDLVRVNEGAYQPVLGFLHMAHDSQSAFLNVFHSHGQFRATPGHIVFTQAGDLPTSQLNVGDHVVSLGPAGFSKVIAVHNSRSALGMYAPFTASGTIVVDDIGSSNYAIPSVGLHLPHTSAHGFFYPLRMFHQFGFSSAEASLQHDVFNPFLKVSYNCLKLDQFFLRWASH